MPPKALGARQDPPARTEDMRLEPPPMPQEPFMELEVNWRLQVVMVPKKEVSERASRQREEKVAREVWEDARAAPCPGTFICTWGRWGPPNC